ncbi:BUB3-interacting and GLEBS motif-containing protein [Escovopsis weberi]|uniref:BUB3-interacting and GLEBS motif-containing protein n=1 Tax=Escovopsis weberi TaxID=150374 RepID=A0A0M8MWC3_ESCWE|nr:BUB3-interacting and GLEBS motif-containing protein [Escovopsis weberi]
MGKKKRGHPDIEEILSRPWCYYCERDFEDLKLLISHQKAKHFKCDRCGRRLNTAGGLSVHLNQVHKETLSQVENALPNRQGLEVEIFGMEGIPQEVLDQHRNRIIQNFYQAQEDRRIATGNPAPGQSKNPRKKIKIESAEDLVKRLVEYRKKRKAAAAAAAAPAGGAMEGVVPTNPSSYNNNTNFPQQPAFGGKPNPYGYPGDSLPARPSSNLPGTPGLPQRPQGAFWNGPDESQPVAAAATATATAGAGASASSGDDIDQLIRMAEAGIKPPRKPEEEEVGEKKGKKDKDKKARMAYEDAEISPEEKMAALPQYAFVPPVGS